MLAQIPSAGRPKAAAGALNILMLGADNRFSASDPAAWLLGGMIVAGPEGFSKSHYRKFNIRSEEIAPGDDAATTAKRAREAVT